MPELQRPEANPTDRISSILAGYVTPKELAQALGVSERTIARRHHFREGPPRVKIGRKVFYRLESVCAWIASCERAEPRAGRTRLRVSIPTQRNNVGALARPGSSDN
jgi:predicted DNA-binding transcriptional regulator AlpA